MAKDSSKRSDGADRIPTRDEALRMAGLTEGSEPTVMAEEEKPSASPIVAGAALRIEPLAISLEKIQPVERSRFWCGTLPGCSHYNVALGTKVAVMFHRITEEVTSRDDPPETVRIPRKGQIFELSQEEVDGILLDVKRRVIRPSSKRDTGDGGRVGFILRTDDATYRPREGDVPLACYIYMVKLSANMPDGYREAFPPALLAMPG